MSTLPRRQTANLSWQLRFTWEPLNSHPHPKFTYDAVDTEDRAIDKAVAAIDRMAGNKELRLVEVHWRHVGSDVWRRVE
jgi:hypothetical protein